MSPAPIDIEASRAICEAATAGPWETAQTHGEQRQVVLSGAYANPTVAVAMRDRSTRAEGDATFIAHARSALPAALDEIERLRVALEDARAALRGEGGK